MKQLRRKPKLKFNQAEARGNDRLSAARRSWNMSRIKGRNTTPELRVRSLLHRLGYRFRLQVRIPVAPVYDRRKSVGTRKTPLQTTSLRSPDFRIRFARPDLVLVQHRLAVFVHDCFWHRHRGCKNCTTPTNNRAFWPKKLHGNAARVLSAAKRPQGTQIPEPLTSTYQC